MGTDDPGMRERLDSAIRELDAVVGQLANSSLNCRKSEKRYQTWYRRPLEGGAAAARREARSPSTDLLLDARHCNLGLGGLKHAIQLHTFDRLLGHQPLCEPTEGGAPLREHIASSVAGLLYQAPRSVFRHSLLGRRVPGAPLEVNLVSDPKGVGRSTLTRPASADPC